MEKNQKNFQFKKEEIFKLTKNIVPVDIIKSSENYNDKLTISQTVKFFERNNVTFTKTMIQNYIKIGILPPPINKRYYVKNHLILLDMINSFKDVYSLEEIGNIFKNIIKDEKNFENNIYIVKIYKEYIHFYENYIDDLNENLSSLFNEIDIKIKDFSIEKDNKISYFLVILSLVVKSVVTKTLTKIINNIEKTLE